MKKSEAQNGFPRRGRPDKQKRQDAETSCHRNITLRFLFRRHLIGFPLAVQRFFQRVPGQHGALDAGRDVGNALQSGYVLQIVQQTEKLEAQQQLIGRQEAYLLAANDELTDMRNQMQTIAVLRLSILEQIRQSIVEVMGDASKVSIGDNGNIILSDSVLFDLGSADI